MNLAKIKTKEELFCRLIKRDFRRQCTRTGWVRTKADDVEIEYARNVEANLERILKKIKPYLPEESKTLQPGEWRKV